MNTAFLVETRSQTCIGVHFDTAHCCLVIFCTTHPSLTPFPVLHPAPSSFLPPLLNTILVSATVSPFSPSHASLPLFPSHLHLHSPSELRGGLWQVTRVVKPDELGTPDESLREQMKKLELSPQATDSAATTTATKNTTPTVSTCCHSYSPMCSRNAIYLISSTSCENSSD